ncbi:MAG: tyrosine--tRNA ligase [Alphaproteobacteria bacterium]|nr:tyrosine--tRNA ligase [Alphaproteobacteria bacterium]MDE2163810.1 tyrosine--tRNA ligase [Alphaproteobacteria bacterium]MDE2499253.1 tyrosine--tRNA ligase [Alphaproteobacteria bacterium]
MINAPNFRSEFLRTVVARGQYYATTNTEGLDALFLQERVTAYIGFDCTAPSLHVGHAMQIMTLRRLQQAGHRPIVLVGGGTTKVGDPSFRNEARPLLSEEQIETNKAAIRGTFANFLTFGDGPTDAIMVDNADWLDKLQYVPFLREIGRHFSVNRMLTMDSVKMKLDNDLPFSFLEFNYMIMQAYDFVELYRRYGCKLQSSGSDQWGNIVSGIDLGRRVENTELFGLTTPLLTTASGAKMGKTAAGAVWLNPDMLSPYDYWQYWRNTEDADVGRFLRIFTDLPLDEIARLTALQGAELNDAKKVLATEATTLAHGRAAAEQAAETARRTFEEGAIDEGLPTFELARGKLEGLAVTALTHLAGLTSSASEARRFIEGGGLRVNDVVVKDVKATVSAADVTGKGFIKLSVGKKKHILIKPV